MLKQIKCEISSSITLIINQSLTTVIFPERIKIAKVIPIYKKDDVKMFENKRPISILPAISKILEKKLFLTNCMIIFKTINYTVKINMDLEETTPQNIPPLSSLTELYSTWTKAKFLLLIVIMRITIAMLSMIPVNHNEDYTVMRIQHTVPNRST